MENLILERFGGLVKKETMSCLEEPLRIHKTCVLESQSPFAGYYPQKGATSPLYIYLMLEGDPSIWDSIFATKKVRSKVNFKFDAAYVRITFPDKRICYALRIRDLSDYHLFQPLQEAYRMAGLELKKNTRMVDGEEVMIEIEKFFYLEPWGDKMYIDRQQPHHGYFEIPEMPSWTEFEKLIHQVKIKTSQTFFDAALAYVYDKKQIVNLVRIYQEHIKNETLIEIRNAFWKVKSDSYSSMGS